MRRLSTRGAARRWLACAAVALCLAAYARAQETVRELPSPAAAGSGQPNLTVDARGRVYLSWVEKQPEGRAALRFAVREGAGWSRPRTVAEGANWFVNWADFPSLLALADGTLAAHWLVRSGPDTYAYDVFVSRSRDGGRRWSTPVRPHRDGTQTEHGFVSMFAAGGGRLGVVWLDGRAMAAAGGGDAHHGGEGHGAMSLRYATLRGRGRATGVGDESLLDARVCECCQTSAALTSEGPVVAYRGRSADELRDIQVVRLRAGRWTTPRAVNADGWRIDGCPVNGPSVAASARRVAVAWFTLERGQTPRVRVAFSRDAGATFAAPFEAADGDPFGHVCVLMLDDGGALVSWIEKTQAGVELRARRVGPDRARGPSITVARAGSARSTGFPRMARAGDKIIFTWTGAGRVMVAEMRAPAL
jgi:hypothetical protein